MRSVRETIPNGKKDIGMFHVNIRRGTLKGLLGYDAKVNGEIILCTDDWKLYIYDIRGLNRFRLFNGKELYEAYSKYGFKFGSTACGLTVNKSGSNNRLYIPEYVEDIHYSEAELVDVDGSLYVCDGDTLRLLCNENDYIEFEDMEDDNMDSLIFKEGSKVLFRDNSYQKWKWGFYLGESNCSTYPYDIYNMTDSEREDFRYCIPYDGNEKLLGTINDFIGKKSEFKWGEHVEVRSEKIKKYPEWTKAIYLGDAPEGGYRAIVIGDSWPHDFTYCRRSDWKE